MKTEKPASSLQGGSKAHGAGRPESKAFDANYRITFPLTFPIKGMRAEIIKDVPDSRLPNAPRTYRGANARHEGMDFYTGKCGLEVVSPSEGWIIDITNRETFPNSKTRDSILEITNKAGITPDPILHNLNGISLVIYHGLDEKGKAYYSRLSHMGRLASEFKIGDFVGRGEVVGYVGATGTSAQFKTGKDKEAGCHLHFETKTCPELYSCWFNPAQIFKQGGNVEWYDIDIANKAKEIANLKATVIQLQKSQANDAKTIATLTAKVKELEGKPSTSPSDLDKDTNSKVTQIWNWIKGIFNVK